MCSRAADAFPRILCTATLLVVVVACVLNAARAAEPAIDAEQVSQFSLVDLAGKQHTADDLRAAKATLLFFLSTECPVSNFYAPEYQRIADKYAAAGVTCLGVHSDPTVTKDEAKTHAADYQLKFPLLLDPEQTLAQAAKVRVTPEAVVLSPTGQVLYRGRMDDRYSTSGKRRDEPTVMDLEKALDAVLAGKSIEVSRTTAFGCPLPKVKAKR